MSIEILAIFSSLLATRRCHCRLLYGKPSSFVGVTNDAQPGQDAKYIKKFITKNNTTFLSN
jgi:hypothetical protein